MDARAQAWSEAKERFEGLVQGASGEQLATRVPCCPDWTVQDLLGHVAGVGIEHVRAADAGEQPPAHSDDWAARTIADRQGADVAAVCAEWDAATPAIVELISGPEPGLIVDLGIHEQDLRGALGAPGARDSAAGGYVAEMLEGRLAASVEEAGAPGLRIVTGGPELVVGTGDPVGTLMVDRWELCRGATGRRSEAQVRAWGWDVDPGPWLASISLFGDYHPTDIVE